jgi:hypothetical protein
LSGLLPSASNDVSHSPATLKQIKTNFPERTLRDSPPFHFLLIA